MRFSFSAEQELLGESARSWVRSLNDGRVHRAALAGADIKKEQLWQQVVDMGWAGIAVAAEAGGGGGDLVDACIVLEALAGGLVPVPFAGNAILVPAIVQDRDDDLLGDVARGRRRIAPLLADDLTWSGDTADAVAWDWWPGDSVLAPGDPPVLFGGELVSGLSTVDPLRPLGRLPRPRSGVPLAPGTARRLVATSQVAASAALLGIMRASMRAAVDHARERRQFARPIGSFQAVQHMCADMLVDVESAWSITYGAAWTVAYGPTDEAATRAAAAKAWCSAAALRVCEQAVQVHGGTGITWESDPHLYLRAAHLWGSAFGTERAALLDVADAVFGPGLCAGQGSRP